MSGGPVDWRYDYDKFAFSGLDKHSVEVSTEGLPPDSIPPIGDIPITEVNQRLYAQVRHADFEEQWQE